MDGIGTPLPLLSAVVPRAGGSASRRNHAAATAWASTWQRPPDLSSERGRVPSGRFEARVIHFWRPPGSSSGAGDLLRRVLGRVEPVCSTSFRRRDRGLRAILLSPSASVLTRTVERHSR